MSGATFWIITILKYILAINLTGIITNFLYSGTLNNAQISFPVILTFVLLFIGILIIMTVTIMSISKKYRDKHFEITGIAFGKISKIIIYENQIANLNINSKKENGNKKIFVGIIYKDGYKKDKFVTNSWLEKHIKQIDTTVVYEKEEETPCSKMNGWWRSDGNYYEFAIRAPKFVYENNEVWKIKLSENPNYRYQIVRTETKNDYKRSVIMFYINEQVGDKAKLYVPNKNGEFGETFLFIHRINDK